MMEKGRQDRHGNEFRRNVFPNPIFEKFLTLLSKQRAGERSVEGEAPSLASLVDK
jgi:hypothetical protein